MDWSEKLNSSLHFLGFRGERSPITERQSGGVAHIGSQSGAAAQNTLAVLLPHDDKAVEWLEKSGNLKVD
jgi:hypothetical protein